MADVQRWAYEQFAREVAAAKLPNDGECVDCALDDMSEASIETLADWARTVIDSARNLVPSWTDAHGFVGPSDD